jgi:hypothetical protein
MNARARMKKLIKISENLIISFNFVETILGQSGQHQDPKDQNLCRQQVSHQAIWGQEHLETKLTC